MDIRAKLRENSTAAAIAALTVAALAVGVSVYSSRGLTDGVKPPKLIGMAFYTIDDGKTLFRDVDDRVTPFEHDGKQAVKAYQFTNGAVRWVQYLEKQDGAGGLLVKRPGAGKWITATDPAAAEIREPRAKDGKTPIPVSAAGG